ncbi:MAG: DUF6554 family protein [Cyanobacteriota bacterium]
MAHRRSRPVVPRALLWCAYLSLGSAALPAIALGADSSPGAKGAQVYCFMRSNGNNHQVSWEAAYALIKRQSASLFKTSPQHGAVMITEAVVQNPGLYPDCGRLLGDLFVKPVTPDSMASPAGGPQSRSERLGQ